MTRHAHRSQQAAPDHFSVAVLPFLKTSGPQRIGGITFRSTDDLTDLSEAQNAAVREITGMLFLQDDLRVKSASYAITPKLEFHRSDAQLRQLQRVHAVLTYFYGVPHDTFGDPFLGPNETSLVLFTPADVSVFLVRPDHHVVALAKSLQTPVNDRHEVRGYAGLFNFRDHFWVAAGSRVYGPARHITLNISQDMACDLGRSRDGRSAQDLLFALLERFDEPERDRVAVALDWYNAAHPDLAGPDRALLNLAVAFESLLRLPRDSKTDRFVDAISMLLGRTERLDHWARQFYDARSDVTHEGLASEHFYMIPSPSGRHEGGRFGSLLHYGRQVFRLCLSAVLFGMDLARKHGLRERFVNNAERYAAICKALKPEAGEAAARLMAIEQLVEDIARFRHVPADPAPQVAMLAAVRAAAQALLEGGADIDPALKSALKEVSGQTRQDDEYAQLEGLQLLQSVLRGLSLPAPDTPQRVLYELVDVVWMTVFHRYFALRKLRAASVPSLNT